MIAGITSDSENPTMLLARLGERGRVPRCELYVQGGRAVVPRVPQHPMGPRRDRGHPPGRLLGLALDLVEIGPVLLSTKEGGWARQMQ